MWRGRPPVLSRRVPSLLPEAQARDAAARGRLTRGARSQLRVHRERLPARTASLARLAPEGLAARRSALRAHAARLGPLTLGHVAPRGRKRAIVAPALTAYDVERQLERGYTLTLTTEGELVRSAAGLVAGRGRDPFCRRHGPLPGGVR